MKRRMKVIGTMLLSAVLGMNSGALLSFVQGESFVLHANAAYDSEIIINAIIELMEHEPEENRETMKNLIGQLMQTLDSDSQAAVTVTAVKVMLDSGNSDWLSMIVLMQSAGTLLMNSETVPQPETAAQTETVPQTETIPQSEQIPQTESVPAEEAFNRIPSELPEYIPDSYIEKILAQEVSVLVPGGWGNNESDSAVTSYSPVNGSGAISPGAGTLTTTFFELDSVALNDSYSEYEQSISRMSVTSDFNAINAAAAGVPARRITYKMNIGANQFDCEIVCFEYNDRMYAVEMMQGNKSLYDYFNVFDTTVGSLHIGTGPAQTEPQVQPETIPQTEPQVQPETMPQTEPQIQPETMPQTEPQVQPETMPQTEPQAQPETAPESTPSVAGVDLSSFTYSVHGREYHFPTQISAMGPGELPLDQNAVLPYDFLPNGENQGTWNELSNTQLFFFESPMSKEILGVSNMNGTPIALSQGILTTLCDTYGPQINVVLPGNVTVGSPETAVTAAFPAFSGIALDGTGYLRENRLIYAANVRDDGCNGYVLISNDAPYYSALSIICDNGTVCEICFECLGKDRAAKLFK